MRMVLSDTPADAMNFPSLRDATIEARKLNGKWNPDGFLISQASDSGACLAFDCEGFVLGYFVELQP